MVGVLPTGLLIVQEVGKRAKSAVNKTRAKLYPFNAEDVAAPRRSGAESERAGTGKKRASRRGMGVGLEVRREPKCSIPCLFMYQNGNRKFVQKEEKEHKKQKR